MNVVGVVGVVGLGSFYALSFRLVVAVDGCRRLAFFFFSCCSALFSGAFLCARVVSVKNVYYVLYVWTFNSIATQ